jgi:hypothetical protein
MSGAEFAAWVAVAVVAAAIVAAVRAGWARRAVARQLTTSLRAAWSTPARPQGDPASRTARRRGPRTRHRRQLDPGILQQLFEALDLLAPRRDLGLR